MTDINFRSLSRINTDLVSYGWASDEAHLTFLVTDEYPNTVKNLGNIISTLNSELGRLEQKVIVINDTILDVAEAEVQVLLEAKRVSNAWFGPVDYFGTFGVDNISDWQIWDIGVSSVAGTQVTIDSFTVTGAVAGQYPVGTPVKVDPGSIVRTVLSATNPPIPPAPQITTIVLNAGPPLPIGPITVFPPDKVYVYLGVGWDSDAAITQEVEAFAIGHDHLTHPLGLTGTYGLNERISQLETGRDLQDANKTAYENFIIWYEPYMQ